MSYGFFMAQGLLVMTLVLELNDIYDCCKGFRLKVKIVEYDLRSIYMLYYGRSPNGLRHANRARRSTSTTLFHVRQKRKLFAPIYSSR
jgi:hypothetical protein